MSRTDAASRVIRAAPETIYRAFTDSHALVAWLPPKGMSAKLVSFDPRPGGGYRMILTYEHPDHAVPGKSSDHADVVAVRYADLTPNERVVEQVDFESDDPAFSGTMTMTWSLVPVPAGTEVRIVAEDVPDGIRREDHEIGLNSSLENLAEFCE